MLVGFFFFFFNLHGWGWGRFKIRAMYEIFLRADRYLSPLDPFPPATTKIHTQRENERENESEREMSCIQT